MVQIETSAGPNVEDDGSPHHAVNAELAIKTWESESAEQRSLDGEALAHICLGIAGPRMNEDQPAVKAKINNDRHRRQLVKGRC